MTGLRSTLIRLAEHRREWFLLGVLFLLYLVALQGIDTRVGRTLFVGHIGLFLLWQPIVRGEKRLSLPALGLIAAVIAGALTWASWGLMIVWIMLLAGIVSGNVSLTGRRYPRLFHLLALAYLVALLLVLVVPQIVPHAAPIPEAFGLLARYGLPTLLGVMTVLPVRHDARGQPEFIDFIYSAFVFLILAVLVLGTLALMLLRQTSYGESLLTTLFGMSVVLLLLGWAWNPRAMFSGLGIQFSRYVLSRGVPFEEWLQRLTEQAVVQANPELFLERACMALGQLPGVSGGDWSGRTKTGQFGTRHGPSQRFEHGDVSIVLYADHGLTPGMLWHLRLLVQLIGEFYSAKVKAEQLQELSYAQAVHETGARLTHDMKNLLQSLNMLCFAASREGDEASPRFQGLLKRQLPAIAERLGQTLDKLRRPTDETAQHVPAQDWWDDLRRRFSQDGVEFSAGVIEASSMVPMQLFNSAVENLLHNALRKRIQQPDLRVRVTFDTAESIAVAVCDSGAPFPPEIADKLFRAPVRSDTGQGIGLYHAAKQAEAAGFRLAILSNMGGQVCVGLEQVRETASRTAARESATKQPAVGRR